MKIDLSTTGIFEDSELELDKKITFVFGKNGTGKSTITGEIRKLDSAYDVSIFQGFDNIIDENHRLNAVVLGEENLIINNKIKEKKKEAEINQNKIDEINKILSKPDVENNSNFWTKRDTAQKNIKQRKENWIIFLRKQHQLLEIKQILKLLKLV